MAGSSPRKLAVLMHADVVGSTALARLDETLAHERFLDTFHRLSGIVAQHGGTTCEIRGDALIAEFDKASDAVSASVDFQGANAIHIGELEDEICPIVRIGIAIGEVIIADNTVTGEGIVLAQRLEQLAEPGGVCIQGAAYETLPKRLPFEFKNLGECELKGFDEPVRVYAVRSISDTPKTRSETTARPQLDRRDFPESPIVAVLPFTNMSGDSEQEYFSDGITEDIITDLSRFRSLNVIARNSTFSFKGQSIKPQQVAEELGATFVVEGSVRKSGTRVRITAQLINAHDGTHVWAERYDRDLADIFEVQDEVSQSIVATVATRLHQSEALMASRKRPDDLNAYDYYLRGLQQYNTSNEQELIEAKRLFGKAIEIDPEYARAHAYLALSIFIQIFYAYTGTEEIDAGLKAASRACALDNNEPLAHAARGLILFTKRQDKEAIASLKTALSLNPNDPQVSQGLGFVLTYAGYPEEGCSNLLMARRLNPLADDTPLGISFYHSGRYADAVEVLGGKHRWGALYLAAGNAQLGNFEEARAAFQIFIDSMQAEARLRGEPEPNSKKILSIEFADLRRESDRTHLIDGLRKAGLNEHLGTENLL